MAQRFQRCNKALNEIQARIGALIVFGGGAVLQPAPLPVFMLRL